MKTIVIAWIEEVQVFDGRPFARDLGALPGMKVETIAHACVWLRKGVADDAIKASNHVRNEHPDTGRVFEFSTTVRDPLGEAKKRIISDR